MCLFIQGWLVILHCRLANDPNPGVAVLGQAFDLTRENSIPTVWAFLQAFGVATIAWLVLGLRRRQGIPMRHSFGWMIAAILFLTIAVDDAASLHERIGSITSLGLIDGIGYPSYPWHLTVAPLFASGVILIVFFLWDDLKEVRGGRALVVAAVACYAISQGIDFVEGVERMSNLPMAGISKLLPHSMVIEEVLEMAGTAMFGCAFAACLLKQVAGIPIIFRGAGATAPEAEDSRAFPTPEGAQDSRSH